MLLRLFLCIILFICPIINGVNTTSSTDNSTTISLPLKDLNEVEVGGNLTKINGLSEGGPITQTTQTIESPKEIHPALLSLDTELGKEKSTVPSNSKVVPRKGVVFDDKLTTLQKVNETINDSTNLTVLDDLKDSAKHSTKQKYPSPSQSTVSPNIALERHNDTQLNDTSSTELNTNKTQAGHKTKPLVLSAEALANMPDFPKDELKIPAIQSSRNTLVADQIQSPRIQMATSRHPGMVMPVVITMLVVPMFAVLGYMAVKRGREAWKNRHYKRMDFLLDGMYND